MIGIIAHQTKTSGNVIVCLKLETSHGNGANIR